MSGVSRLRVGSNGTLAGVVNNGDGTSTTTWKERYPIATYLVSVAISNYVAFSNWFHYGSGDSMEVLNYILPSKLAQAQVDLPRTVTMLEIFSDLFGLYPFIDSGSGGSVAGAIAAVEAILEVADAGTKIIPGHGPIGDKKALTAYLAFLRDVSGRVQKLMDEGKSLEEIQALKPLADYDATLGTGFFKPDTFLGILYNGLKKK